MMRRQEYQSTPVSGAKPVLTIILPMLPPRVLSPNGSNVHWSQQWREKQAIKDQVRALVLEQGWPGPPIQQARVVISFGLPDRRVRDDDNLMGNGMVKAILDALTGKVRNIGPMGKPNGPWLPDRFVLQDDSRKHVTVECRTHESPGRPETRVEILG